MHWRTPSSSPSLPAPTPALALQGGGAYGAFTWGVLDRLLESGIRPSALSGASAGAVNAVALAYGWRQSGPDGARATLRQVWDGIGKMATFSPLGLPGAGMQLDLMTRVLSPYQFNPLNVNPLRDLLAGLIDFESLRGQAPFPLFIATTHVSSGALRIFREQELSLDVLMASACLPTLHHAVEIDGEAYWDGGFSANPPVLPMVMRTDCRSVLVVKLTPDAEPGNPVAAPDIAARLRRIWFNTPVLRELDAIADLQTSLRDGIGHGGGLPPDMERLRDLEIRSIALPAEYLGGSSALNPKPEFLETLFQAGREQAEFMAQTP